MGGRPDILKAIVVIFAVGLLITGFTTLQASDSKPRLENSVNFGALQAEVYAAGRAIND
ncbi:hypothetical protein [Marinobacter sp. C2H3]|uniref:hypothetical protein n=1 Tax=Marinobacter sp. C2H3 TaxID=3119003 RepID=UPI00300E8413